jgi:hypothetical protein
VIAPVAGIASERTLLKIGLVSSGALEIALRSVAKGPTIPDLMAGLQFTVVQRARENGGRVRFGSAANNV